MTDRFNTIAGWALFAGIIALGLSIVSGMFFHADKPERPEQMGYPIEGVVEEGAADAGPSLAELLASGSAEAGEAVFAKCTSCHTIDQGGANGIGPNLWGVLGTGIGEHAAGFAYSSALSSVDGSWTYEAMDEWLKSPRAFANGTKMSFAGLSSGEDRANVMLYMREHGGGPALPEAPAAEAADEGAAAEGEAAESGEAAGDTAADAGATATDEPVAGEDQTNPVGE